MSENVTEFIWGIIGNWVAGAIAASAAVGIAIGWLKKKASPWLTPVCWGVGGAAVILIGMAALMAVWTLSAISPATHEVVTTDNVEEHLVRWIDAYHFSRRKDPDNPNLYFSYFLTNSFGRKQSVVRSRQRPADRYLTLLATVAFDPVIQEKLTMLSKPKADRLISDLKIEMARLRVGFVNIKMPLTTIALEKSLPITRDLTEASFVQAVGEIDLAIIILLTLVPMEIDELSRQR